MHYLRTPSIHRTTRASIGQPQLHSDTASFLLLALGRVAAAGGALAVSVIVGRALGPAALGQWSLLVAAGTFLHTAFINWTHGPTVRFGAEAWAKTGDVGRVLSNRLPLVIGGIVVAAAALVLQPFDWLSTLFGVERRWATVVAVYALAVWMASEAQALAQAASRIRVHAVASVIAAALTLLLILAGIGAAVRQVPRLFLVVSIGVAAFWAGSWLWTARGVVRSRGLPTYAETRRYARYAIPMLLAFVVAYVSNWGDHLLLQILSTVEGVGQFGLAYQVFMMLTAGAGLLNIVGLPRLIQFSQQRLDAETAYVREIIPTILVLWTCLALMGVGLIPILFGVLAGSSFEPAFGPLLVLCIVIPTQALHSLYGILFNLQERLGRTVGYFSTMAILNVGVSVLLIPRLGIAGASWGTVAATVFIQVAYVLDQHRYYRAPVLPVGVFTVVVLLLGIAQATVDVGVSGRIGWTILSIGVVLVLGRWLMPIHGPTLQQIFTGGLSPVGSIVRRALIRGTEAA